MSNGLYPPPKRDMRSRIRRLEEMIKESKDKQKAVAMFCLNEGVALRKVREYLLILRLAGKIDKDVTI